MLWLIIGAGALAVLCRLGCRPDPFNPASGGLRLDGTPHEQAESARVRVRVRGRQGVTSCLDLDMDMPAGHPVGTVLCLVLLHPAAKQPAR
jgi:hypothetical protein